MLERLADLTTLRLGGPARELVRATTEDELLAAVRTADDAGTPLLLVAGGSNLVVADEGFDGTVVLVETTGVEPEPDTCGGAVVTVAAGESWDAFVERAVQEGWVGDHEVAAARDEQHRGAGLVRATYGGQQLVLGGRAHELAGGAAQAQCRVVGQQLGPVRHAAPPGACRGPTRRRR